VRFRTKALAKRRQAEALDRLPEVAKPRGWLAAIALGVVVIGVLVYLLAGTVPRRVSASGVLSSPGGLIEVQSTTSGLVTKLLVSPGQEVTPQTAVADIVDTKGKSSTILSGFTGTVLETDTGPGRILTLGSPVITLAGSHGTSVTSAYLLLSQKDAGGVAPGMSVDLNVSTAPSARFGSLRGRVSSVSGVPISPQELDVLLGNDALAQQFLQGGPPVLATVALNPAPTPSGLSWSSGSGPPFKLAPGALVKGDVEQGNQKVLDLVLGNG
jgi:multidrug efflux pump subunit AcrA (membrane-fusion protein)